MPTTRNQAKQSHIEDFVKEDPPSQSKKPKRVERPKKNDMPEKDAFEELKAEGKSSKGKRSTEESEGNPQSHAAPEKSPKSDPPAKRQKTTSKSPIAEKKPTPRSKSPTLAKKSISKQNTALMQGKDKNAPADTTTHDDDETITINRAPVLDLWATTVTHFLYPSLPWDTCLSAGSAISALCAVSKGRSIGVIDPKDDTANKKARNEHADQFEEIQVMGFSLKLKDDLVIVSGDKKPANEAAQKRKFGESKYDHAKAAFEEALESWKDDKDELNKKAFHFYEQFRPTVAQGQKGWGRKGELDLGTVKQIVQKTV